MEKVLVFLTGTIAGIAALKLYEQHISTRKKKITKKEMKKDVAEDELLQEQLSRVETFFGKKGFEQLKDAFVIVVGLGGVGSHAAHMLARSGVGKMRLIDFDNVTLSSLNRHAVATREDVGISKVAATKKHILKIIPTCEIDARAQMFEASVAEELLAGNPTYVLDCIDDVNTKIDLLSHASEKGLTLITAAGAGAKADPTRICIGDLTDANRDPLATKLRYFMRKRNIDPATIKTVYSSEPAQCKLLPLEASQAEQPDAFGNVENFRIRIIPVLGTMPAIFGQTMATYVLSDICGNKIRPESVARLSKEQRNKMFMRLQQREARLADNPKLKIDIDRSDIDFIVQEVWRNRSAVSGRRLGGNDSMMLMRWNPDKKLTPVNVILVTVKEAALIDEKGKEALDESVIQAISERLSHPEWKDW